MKAKVVRIGKLPGVLLPKAALRQARLSVGQRVRLEVVEGTIVIRPEHTARRGWKEAFARAGAPGSEDLWHGVPNDEAWEIPTR